MKSPANPEKSSSPARVSDATPVAHNNVATLQFPDVMVGAPVAPRAPIDVSQSRHLEVPSITTVVAPAAPEKQSTVIAAADLQVNPQVVISNVLKHSDLPGKLPTGDGQPIEAANETETRKQKVTSIEVVAQDQNVDPSKRVSQADVRIDEKGNVEFLTNPDKNNNQKLVIEVARAQGDVGALNPVQQASLDVVTQELAGRFMAKSSDGGVAGTIVDSQGLLSQQAKLALKPEPTPIQNLPEPMQQAVAETQRFNTAGRGTLSPQQVNDMVPTRPADIQRLPSETNERLSLQDVLAKLYGGQSYEAVTPVRDGKLGVGRYLLTGDALAEAWWDLESSTNPELAKLLEKNPKLKAAFANLVNKLRKGEKPTAQEIKAGLPKELQEKLAGHLIEKFGKQTGNDPAKTVLAMQLGRVPTDKDLAAPENKAVMQAAGRLFQISSAGMANPGKALDWQNNGDNLLLAAKQNVGRAVWAESGFSHKDLQYGNVGCMATISRLCELAGIKGVHAAVVDDGIAQLKARGYKEVSTPRPGSIVRFMKGGEGWHIGVYAGNGQVIDNSSSARVLKQRALSAVYDSGGFTGMKYYDRA